MLKTYWFSLERIPWYQTNYILKFDVFLYLYIGITNLINSLYNGILFNFLSSAGYFLNSPQLLGIISLPWIVYYFITLSHWVLFHYPELLCIISLPWITVYYIITLNYCEIFHYPELLCIILLPWITVYYFITHYCVLFHYPEPLGIFSLPWITWYYFITLNYRELFHYHDSLGII